MADEKDPALEAMRAVVAAVKAALKASPTDDTECKLVIGLLETACTFGVAFGVPAVVLAVMFAEALDGAHDRVASIKAKHAGEAQQAAAPTPATPAPTPAVPADPALTPQQVAEIMARLKEGGHVH